MRSSRVADKLKHVGEADNGRANPNITPLVNRSDAGFLLLDAALKPLYVNAQAGEILFHPERPTKTKDFADQLASKVRTIVAYGGSNGASKGRFNGGSNGASHGRSNGAISICKELVSGNRHYVCRFFEIHLPGDNSNGSNNSSLALLLERSPEASADILKICRQYHLSQREGEVVRHLVHGLATKEIAARMNISPNTVKVFLRLVMMKMGVSSRSGIMSKFIHLKA